MRLYVLAEHRVKTDGRLGFEFAGPFPGFHGLDLETNPEEFFPANSPGGRFLTRFEGELTPAQMAEDLYLEPDGESTYRRTIIG